MAQYSKTEWANGDLITAARLNKMENGIAGLSDEIVQMSNDLVHKVLSFESGKYWTKNNTTNKIDKGAYSIVDAYERIPISVGDKFYIKCRGVGTAPTYLISDENMNYISDGGANAIDTVITITDENAKYLYVNHLNNQTTVDFRLYLVSETTEGLTKKLKYDIGIDIANVRKNAMGIIETATSVNWNTSTKTLECGALTYIMCGGNKYNISNKNYVLTSVASGGYLFYNPSNDSFSNNYSDGYYYMGAWWADAYRNDLHLSDSKKLLIDGMPYRLTNGSGRRIACLGDSMTFGTGTTKAYCLWFKQLLSLEALNAYGVSGSCIAPKVDTYPDWEEGIPSFYERYTTMDNSAYYVTVFGGVNDWVVGRELGALSDRVSTTFCGAFRLMIEGLIEKYPHQRIFVFTSPQNDYVNRPANIPSSNQYYGNTVGKNRLGYTQKQYMDAMISICKEYAITCYDMYSNLIYGLSGVLGDDKGTSGIYGSDGLHPNAELHKRIATIMAETIIANS